MDTARDCRICGEVYRELGEIHRIERTGFCTECAGSNPLCAPDFLPYWRLDRRRLARALAERFALPRRIIGELLECCTAEELLDLLSEMEAAGTLAAERTRLHAERRTADRRNPRPGRRA